MFARLTSSVVGLPIIVGCVLMGEPWLTMLVLVVASIGIWEFYRIVRLRGARPSMILGLSWAILIITNGLTFNLHPMALISAGGTVTFLWHQLSLHPSLGLAPAGAYNADTRNRFANGMVDWFYTVTGSVYIGWILSLTLIIRTSDNGVAWVLLAIFGTFATDTGSFVIGKLIGRNHLLPMISPNKTIEGSIGGLVLGFVSVIILLSSLGLNLSFPLSILLAVSIPILSQIGDLLESVIKRSSKIKDSGSLIPGHGGMLDRLDSILLVILIVWVFLL